MRVRFPLSAETFCRPLAILRGTEPVSALTRAFLLLMCSWILSFLISRWQSFISEHDYPTSTVLEHRQWPEVYDLCHTFLHVARVKNPRICENRTRFKKNTDMREWHAFRVRFFHVRVYLTRTTGKNVLQDRIPWATAYWSTWSLTRGQDSATCADLAYGHDYSDCRASGQKSQKCLALAFPWIVENTWKTKATLEGFSTLIPQTAWTCGSVPMPYFNSETNE